MTSIAYEASKVSSANDMFMKSPWANEHTWLRDSYFTARSPRWIWYLLLFSPTTSEPEKLWRRCRILHACLRSCVRLLVCYHVTAHRAKSRRGPPQKRRAPSTTRPWTVYRHAQEVAVVAETRDYFTGGYVSGHLP